MKVKVELKGYEYDVEVPNPTRLLAWAVKQKVLDALAGTEFSDRRIEASRDDIDKIVRALFPHP